jgi:hypothetical protein
MISSINRLNCGSRFEDGRNANCSTRIKTIFMEKKSGKSAAARAEDKKFPLPEYPANEDIYKKEEEESLEEQTSKKQRLKEGMDEGLDVPGADLDDEDEFIGEEDEENNYYSLGGDDHSDLEEDKGE